MQKFLGLCSCAAMLMAAEIALAQGTYVRKKVEPDFFMPESAKVQPEKLPMPKYYKGQEETIKNAKPEPEPQRLPPVATEDDGINGDEGVLDDLENTPEYQQKFEDYSNDLEHINQTGQIPQNADLDSDLNQMNSSARRVVNRKPYQTRNARAKFDKALQDSLNSD